MNANWQSVLAGISNGLMSVSVLPGRRKVLPVFLVALLPALLMAVIVVIPSVTSCVRQASVLWCWKVRWIRPANFWQRIP